MPIQLVGLLHRGARKPICNSLAVKTRSGLRNRVHQLYPITRGKHGYRGAIANTNPVFENVPLGRKRLMVSDTYLIRTAKSGGGGANYCNTIPSALCATRCQTEEAGCGIELQPIPIALESVTRAQQVLQKAISNGPTGRQDTAYKIS